MPPDDNQLTADEQAALDAQRNAVPEETGQDAAEAPQEAAETQEAPAEGEQSPAADKRPQMVPHAALHEERERRKEVERRFAELERRSEERFNTILQRFQPAAQPETPAEPAIPDVQQDVVGHIVGKMQQLGASQEQINQELASRRQEQQQVQVIAAIQQRSLAMEAEYRQENADYDNAVGYLRQFRDRQLAAAGWSDPARRHQQIMSEALGIAAQALQEGANPAERLYRLSEASGYAKPAVAQQSAGADDQSQKLETIARGQQQARSIGTARGAGPSPMTAEKLLKMNDKDFGEWAKKSPDAKKFLGL